MLKAHYIKVFIFKISIFNFGLRVTPIELKIHKIEDLPQVIVSIWVTTVITMSCVMLINLNYDCDYVLNMILSAIYMTICVFEFLSVHRRKIRLILCYKKIN